MLADLRVMRPSASARAAQGHSVSRHVHRGSAGTCDVALFRGLLLGAQYCFERAACVGAGSAPCRRHRSRPPISICTYPSDTAVSPGTRFTLALEIMPKRGMHVYAPGAKNYRVISLNIAPQPHVRTMPLRYPPSEIYNFVPLNERVPVSETVHAADGRGTGSDGRGRKASPAAETSS